MTFSFIVLSVVIFIVLSVVVQCVYTLQVDHNLRKDFDLVEYEAVDLQSYHQIVIALKQNNLDYLEAFVHRVSDPSSDNYGKYLSRNEVGELTRNDVALNAVKNYLRTNNIFEYEETLYGEYVTAIASLERWEELLSAKFMPYKHLASGELYFRSTTLDLHPSLLEHIFAIYNVVDLPFLENNNGPVISIGKNTTLSPGHISPSL